MMGKHERIGGDFWPYGIAVGERRWNCKQQRCRCLFVQESNLEYQHHTWAQLLVGACGDVTRHVIQDFIGEFP